MKAVLSAEKHPYLNYNEQQALGAVIAEVPLLIEAMKEIVLYGSKARGDFSEESDIDLLFVSDGPVSRQKKIEVYDALYELEVDHDVVISAVFADSEAYAADGSHFLRTVKKEGVLLWSRG